MAKWLGKRAQALSEAVNKNTEKTEFPPEFTEMEKQSDAFKDIVEKLTKSIPLFLHPNPAARAKMTLSAGISRLQKKGGQRYPHALGEISEIAADGIKLGDDSLFGSALVATADAFNQIIEANHSFDADVQANFLDPLKAIQEHEIKDILRHRKKLEGRRLDYDYKRRQQKTGGKVTDAEIKAADDKMSDSLNIVGTSINSLFDADPDHVARLAAFVKAYLEFAQTTVDILTGLDATLSEKVSEGASRPKQERRSVPKVQSYDDDDDDDDDGGAGPASKPCVRAVYDFQAENPGELSFREGDMITLKRKIDENWFEGEFRGTVGMFPSTYVEIVRDI